MSFEGVGAGRSNLLVYGDIQRGGDENSDASTLGGRTLEVNEGAPPSRTDRSAMRFVKDFLAARRQGGASMLSNFTAVAGRKLGAATHMFSRTGSTTPNLPENAPTNRPIAALANGVNMQTMEQNVAAIDKMTGNVKLPREAKAMMALSPTLMTHLQNYSDMGYTLHAELGQDRPAVEFNTHDFCVISISYDAMLEDPEAAVNTLAEQLIAREGDELHSVSSTLANEGKINGRDVQDLSMALLDPFGPKVSKEEVAQAKEIKAHLEAEAPRVKDELRNVAEVGVENFFANEGPELTADQQRHFE